MHKDTFFFFTPTFKVSSVRCGVVVSGGGGGVCLCCGSRLGRMAPLATPTFGSVAWKRSSLARLNTPSSGFSSSPLASPTTGSAMGSPTPRPRGVSPRVRKPLARPRPGPSVKSGSPLLRPTAGSCGCSALPRPSQGTPVMPLRSGGLFGSIWSTADVTTMG